MVPAFGSSPDIRNNFTWFHPDCRIPEEVIISFYLLFLKRDTIRTNLNALVGVRWRTAKLVCPILGCTPFE
jgi:hypothetical protein